MYDELVKGVNDLETAWAAGDWAGVARSSGVLLGQFADLVSAFTGGRFLAAAPADEAALAAAVTRLEACCAAPRAAAAPSGFDPSSLILLVQALVALWKSWASR